MKLTKLDKNAHWWKGTRTTWWYQDKDGWCWIIRDRDKKTKMNGTPMKIKKDQSEKSARLSLKFYLWISLASAVGVFAAFLLARLFLL